VEFRTYFRHLPYAIRYFAFGVAKAMTIEWLRSGSENGRTLSAMAIQVPFEKWVKGDWREIACLRGSAEEMERRLGASFREGFDSYWGPFREAGFQTPNGRKFGLTHYLKVPERLKAPKGPVLMVTCLYDDKFAGDLEDVLESLDMDLSDVAILNSSLAINPEVRLVPHALWRQDDNGVRALVEVCPCRASASKQMRAFEASGHKQTYWIERQAG
jgi:hypothetical protein